MSQVQAGDTVRIHYTGTLDDGSVFDSSEGRAPLTFTVGAGHVIPGFDEAVVGMAVGEKKNVTIEADRAYGDLRDELLQEVDRADLPEGLSLNIGDAVPMTADNGQQMTATVYAMNDETIVLNTNHPLAGEDLTFDIELVEVLSEDEGRAFQEQLSASAPQVQRLEVPIAEFGDALPPIGEQINLNTPDGSFPAIVVEIRPDVVVLDVILPAAPPVRRIEIPKDQLSGGPAPEVGQELTLNTPEGTFPARVVEIRDDVYVLDVLMQGPPVQRVEVPRAQLPPDVTPQVGDQVMMNGPNGEIFPAQVVEVQEDVVVLDILLMPIDPNQLPPEAGGMAGGAPGQAPGGAPQGGGSGLLGPDGRPIGSGGASSGEKTSPGGLILP